MLKAVKKQDKESVKRLLQRGADVNGYEEAVKWFKKAAEQGDVDAIKKLAELHNDGFVLN